MNIPRNDQQGILEALFLNRVEGLNWHYFELDLHKLTTNNGSIDYRIPKPNTPKILDHIKKNARGNYAFQIPYNRALDSMTLATPNDIFLELLEFMRSQKGVSGKILKKIFETPNPIIDNISEGDMGKVDITNRPTYEKNPKSLFQKVCSKVSIKVKKILLLEDKSRFQHPVLHFLSDRVNAFASWRSVKDKSANYNLAVGEDCLHNMVKMANYIDPFDKVSSDVFLFSKRGNHMVGRQRFAKMLLRAEHKINIETNSRAQRLLRLRLQSPISADIDVAKYKRGLAYLGDEFYYFISYAMSQYFLLLSESVAIPKYKEHIMLITQSHGGTIPTASRNDFPISRNRLSKWLLESMCMKRINKPETQEAILYTMIYEFNEMLIQLARYKDFPKLHHIDAQQDRFDEIHLKSKKHKQIAQTNKACMAATPSAQKVYKVCKDKQYL